MPDTVSVFPFSFPDVDPDREHAERTGALLVEGGLGRLEVAAGPDDAEVLLFTDCHRLDDDWRLLRLQRHELVRAHPGRVVVYNERARPWAGFPGLYVSMPAPAFEPDRQVAVPYLRVHELVAGIEPSSSRDLLFSFVGGRSHRCRDAVLRLEHRRGLVEHAAPYQVWDEDAGPKEHFRRTLGRSKFVLCPRGHATSSFRLYEAMAAGCVPVIISDDWVAPLGPAWERFSVRWPERRVADLPAHLELLEDQAEDMGREARQAFDRWCAPGRAVADGLLRLLSMPSAMATRRSGPATWLLDTRYRRLSMARAAALVRQRRSP